MSKFSQVLVVDNRSEIRSQLSTHLSRKGIEAIEACDGTSGWKMFQKHSPRLVVAYIGMPDSNAAKLLRCIRSSSSVPLLVLTAFGDDRTGIEEAADRGNGARSTPFGVERLISLIEQYLEDAAVVAQVHRVDAREIVGRSQCMSRVRRQVQGIAPLKNLPVLVCGEPGTGKSHVVESILCLAGNSRSDLFAVSSGKLKKDLANGKCEAIFLDGIENLSADDQEFVARTYSAKGERRLGSLPRLFASTSLNINTAVDSGGVVPDLAAVFRRVVIELPPLRDRPSDIAQLVPMLAARVGNELGRPEVRFGSGAIAKLRQYSWPGNVRELSEVVEQLVAFSASRVVGPREVAEALRFNSSTVHTARHQREEAQRRRLEELLRETGGNLAEAARQLGLSRSTVHYRALKFGLIERRAAEMES